MRIGRLHTFEKEKRTLRHEGFLRMFSFTVITTDILNYLIENAHNSEKLEVPVQNRTPSHRERVDALATRLSPREKICRRSYFGFEELTDVAHGNSKLLVKISKMR
ncbi:jg20202 [Pararge aegeria aegeria]|uniref:Jg20202 protein n=1 Tax=Pararge aegeria aegeria TaxID=348720 RepID=A0A8S4R3T1_9NEOP|nr:jg20202 [Pararge aegeria aegeria]